SGDRLGLRRLGPQQHRPRGRDHRDHARHLSGDQRLGVAADELVQRPRGDGRPMTAAADRGHAPPMRIAAGPWHWLRTRLFRGPVDVLVTVGCLYLLYLALPPALDWLFLSARWAGESRDACTDGGACWVFIRVRFGQF